MILANMKTTSRVGQLGTFKEHLKSVSDPTTKNTLIACKKAYKIGKDVFGEGIKLL